MCPRRYPRAEPGDSAWGKLIQMKTIRARYVHTNVIAKDWRALALFYQNVFGCVPVPPERDYRGPALDAGTALVGAHLAGVTCACPDMETTVQRLRSTTTLRWSSALRPWSIARVSGTSRLKWMMLTRRAR